MKNVLESPDYLFYDLFSKAMVAMGKTKIRGIHTYLVIPYIKENDKLKVVTIYPCRDINREIERNEGIRWIKIK
ncbi:MAG: hypothetical protein QMD71_01085 [bacterium]|nr:hypothetical protein [bacterium]